MITTHAALLYLDGRTRIAVTGEDARTWLNGVVTCDVKPMVDATKPQAVYGCALDLKGKVLADLIVTVDADKKSAAAWVPPRSLARLLELWERYVVMEDVELAHDPGRQLLMLQGDRAASIAEAAGIAARGAALDDLGHGAGLVFDLARAESEEVVRRLVAAGATKLEDEDVRRLRVEKARPTFGVDLDEASYVQEAGLDKRAVSFSKGCYLGQEVVCMLQMRGHPTKRLVQLAVPPGPHLEAGSEVSADGAAIGKITSVVTHEDGTAVALAMIKFALAKVGAHVDVGGRRAEIVAEAS